MQHVPKTLSKKHEGSHFLDAEFSGVRPVGKVEDKESDTVGLTYVALLWLSNKWSVKLIAASCESYLCDVADAHLRSLVTPLCFTCGCCRNCSRPCCCLTTVSTGVWDPGFRGLGLRLYC